jgi:hypothetical protein
VPEHSGDAFATCSIMWVAGYELKAIDAPGRTAQIDLHGRGNGGNGNVGQPRRHSLPDFRIPGGGIRRTKTEGGKAEMLIGGVSEMPHSGRTSSLTEAVFLLCVYLLCAKVPYWPCHLKAMPRVRRGCTAMVARWAP